MSTTIHDPNQVLKDPRSRKLLSEINAEWHDYLIIYCKPTDKTWNYWNILIELQGRVVWKDQEYDGHVTAINFSEGRTFAFWDANIPNEIRSLLQLHLHNHLYSIFTSGDNSNE